MDSLKEEEKHVLIENKVPKEGITKVWSSKFYEDEWLEARLRVKTQHQKFLDWAKSAIRDEKSR